MITEAQVRSDAQFKAFMDAEYRRDIAFKEFQQTHIAALTALTAANHAAIAEVRELRADLRYPVHPPLPHERLEKKE
jgi:hypothetical protein